MFDYIQKEAQPNNPTFFETYDRAINRLVNFSAMLDWKIYHTKFIIMPCRNDCFGVTKTFSSFFYKLDQNLVKQTIVYCCSWPEMHQRWDIQQ